MGECKPLDLGFMAELHGVFDCAVAPANLGRVLVGSILRVMDEEVSARDELGMLQIVPSDFAFAVSQYA